MFFGQFSGGEVFPVIGMRSTKSIVFEQNVFGIICFISFCLALYLGSSRFFRSLLFIGALISFIVVYCPLALRGRPSWLGMFGLLLLGGTVCVLYGELLYDVLKLHQAQGLTGRIYVARRLIKDGLTRLY